VIFEPVVRFYKAFKDLKSYENKILKKTEHYFAITHKTENVPKAPRKGTILFFFFKIAYFIRFRMLSVGGRDMNYFPGCTKGSADARKDPQMHKRIRRCTKGSADAQKDPLGVPPSLEF